MMVRPILALSLWHGLRRLRGIGLVFVGIADNSVIPMPGSTDVLTIWLSASERRFWPYYAAMATLGALVGGYITYDLARRGGRKTGKARKLYRSFERWGFGPWPFPPYSRLPFPSFPSCWRQAPCNIPARNSWRPWRSAGEFASPSSPPWELITGTRSKASLRNITTGTDRADRCSGARSHAGARRIPPLSQSHESARPRRFERRLRADGRGWRVEEVGPLG